MPRKTIHTIGELGVGQRLVLEHHRDRIRRALHLPGKHIHQSPNPTEFVLGGIPHLEHLGALDLVEQIHIPHRQDRIGHSCTEDTGEPIGEDLHRRGIEQIRRISQLDQITVRAVAGNRDL
ncbi:hypothetical protein RDE2_35640 [Rhodococcus sp. RDE2]|nr:hypothetical protein RDE2_35640 [Rhodococcus sp. RDE2]